MRFEDLEVWKRSARLSVELYRVLRDCRDFGFRDQITRSGLSVPSNIAEGFERVSDKEALQFFSYAKGSAGELRTQLYVGVEIGFISKDAGARFKRESEEISRMLGGLIRSRKAALGKIEGESNKDKVERTK